MSQSYASAAYDFRHARRQAGLEQIVARLTGRSAELLSYEDVRQKLKLKSRGRRELKEIPLDAIVGSVGRYTDFTRSFLPKQDANKDRWARVKSAMTDMTGVPPIEVYQIGDAYFVADGNHRVSVARQLDVTYIEAYVTEIPSMVPLSPDDEPEDLILKAEYADFLEHTQLDKTRPEADLTVTVPGQYRLLEEHIQVHRYFMGLEQQREIPYAEAAAHWYDYVYLPVARIIQERDLLDDFSDRTETDLYLWIAEHRAELERELEWDVGSDEAAADLATQASNRPARVIARVSEKIKDALIPDELEAGPPAGEWRAGRLAARQDERLFADVLVAVNGKESGWRALDQALEVARREGSRLLGLHVVLEEEARESKAAQAVQTEFDRRCAEAGIPSKLVLAVGKVSRLVCERARWADLVVVGLTYPPASQPLARLGSGFSTLLQRCPRPVLVVPESTPAMHRALLAYDGSPKAEEALFVATYLAGRWGLLLAVVTVLEKGQVDPETLARAREYLEAHGIQADFLQKEGPVAETILETAEAQQSDMIIMGGYGRGPLIEAVLGSSVDEVLRTARQSMLICR